jgi:hypothetical protein
MKTYHIKPEFLEAWGNETTPETVIDEAELDRLAAEWGLEKAALLEQLEELED